MHRTSICVLQRSIDKSNVWKPFLSNTTNSFAYFSLKAGSNRYDTRQQNEHSTLRSSSISKVRNEKSVFNVSKRKSKSKILSKENHKNFAEEWQEWAVPLLKADTSRQTFMEICDKMAALDPLDPKFKTLDPTFLPSALKNRLVQGDKSLARALLLAVAEFPFEAVPPTVWTDFFFTIIMQAKYRKIRVLKELREYQDIFDLIKAKYGAEFLGQALIPVINGCIGMQLWNPGCFLTLKYLQMDLLHPNNEFPSSILGRLVSGMRRAGKYEEILHFMATVMDHQKEGKVALQPQVYVALCDICSSNNTKERGHSYALLANHLINQLDFEKLHHHEDMTGPHSKKLLGAILRSLMEKNQFNRVLRCFKNFVDAGVVPDENIYVYVLQSCLKLGKYYDFRQIYRRMVQQDRLVDSVAGFAIATRYCNITNDVKFLEKEVLEEGLYLTGDKIPKKMSHVAYNDALLCLARCGTLDSATRLFDFMSVHVSTMEMDEVTMVAMVESYRNQSLEEIFELLDIFIEKGMHPTLEVYTSLLAICSSRRLVEDAQAVYQMILQQGFEPDIKVYTPLVFIYASRCDVAGIVKLLHEMKERQIEMDEQFFQYMFTALNDSAGADACFLLFREMRVAQGFDFPKNLYLALIDIGTKSGFIERTLSMAYNMECEGFALPSAKMLELIKKTKSAVEAKHLVKTFELLHQGNKMMREPFDKSVYDAVKELLLRLSMQDEASHIQRMIERKKRDEMSTKHDRANNQTKNLG
jgi:pentatricopeptide repeat protein